MKKEVKLYNVIFPIWLLMIFPQTWLISLPANFIIDLLVLWVTMKILKIDDRKEKASKTILKTWISGFGADFIGGLVLFCAIYMLSIEGTAFGDWWYENVTSAAYNPFQTVPAFLCTTICVLISAFFIYVLNRKWCLKELDIEDEKKKKIAFSLAVFTAPYLFYLPTIWFF